ncbi:histidine--tRNA ligase [Inquilinus limosus]|uniref:histidine--tRNA ligase n=1 Tax=Inquilinus limosus TaxID=171674 RepID=UPI003F191A82
MSETRIVKPQPISGFPEWLPEEKLVEDRILRIIREEYERYGFTPIETAAVERREILTAKGIVEKEIYALSRLAAGEGEDPSTDMALHFDLTVPTARYVAQNAARLTFPFRRYQIQKVWRGERPQAGRFREFYQADIDVIGNGSLGFLADAEIPCVINAIFSRIGIGEFVIRINNRKLLQGYLADQGLSAEGVGAALKVIDAIEKVSRERTIADLSAQAGVDAAAAERIVDLVTRPVTIDDLRAIEGGVLYREGLDELGQVADGLAAFQVPARRWRIDLAIVRGLDYYTGTVYETQLVANPEVGSICSGGRYEDLASNYTRQKLPGVGISIGVTRLLSRLFDAGLLKPGAATPAPVLVTVMDRAQLPYYLGLATTLRAGGIATELFTEGRKVGDQLKYADKKGFRLAVIAGETEIAAGTAVLKDLVSGEQQTHPQGELVEAVRRVLAG